MLILLVNVDKEEQAEFKKNTTIFDNVRFVESTEEGAISILQGFKADVVIIGRDVDTI